MDKLDRLKKYANGGKVVKLDDGGPIKGQTNENGEMWDGMRWIDKETQNLVRLNNEARLQSPNQGGYIRPQIGIQTTTVSPNSSQLGWDQNTNTVTGNVTIDSKVNDGLSQFKGLEEDTSVIAEEGLDKKKEDPEGTAKTWKPSTAEAQLMGGAAIAAVNAIDTATMGDKNFSASSKAIDTTVHGVSSALMKSGNPWAIGGAVLLEGLNFATKAGGQNVQGYDVDIQNSGYGNLSHQDSEAGRVWDKWSGATSRKLAKRNEQARMALAAADISQDQKLEQEARANSVEDILRQNTIALNGGIDTSLLGS